MPLAKGKHGPIENIIDNAENIARLVGLRAKGAKGIHAASKKLRETGDKKVNVQTLRRLLKEQITATLSDVSYLQKLQEKLYKVEMISSMESGDAKPKP